MFAEDLPPTPPPPEQPADTMARGAAIGRYVVLSLLGRGGMGDVYAAYDPELDRKIAVKLLRARTSMASSAGDSEGRIRLLREAQAIAKLSHPNVVVVYDVGTFEENVFLAMEFIEGHTLRSWMQLERRSWKDVLRVFLPAGKGLAAAHEAGVVHRDFKSDNVMVGRDGKVRVMDFGLARQTTADEGGASARPAAEAEPAEPAAADGAPPASGTPPPARSSAPAAEITQAILTSARPLDTNITQSGAMLGTPAYMAPEQFGSKTSDARTDQFSYCVALYEALYGHRPFEGKSYLALLSNVSKGQVREAAAGSGVPAWLRRVLLRGLSSQPEARYPSMAALLSALEKDPSVARRRWAVRTGTALLTVLAVVAATRASQRHRVSPCEGGAAKLAGIWEPRGVDSARKAAVRAAFLGTGKSYAARTFDSVSRLLDRYVTDWTAIYSDACEATAVRGEQSAEVLDLRMTCLNGRLDSVKALAEVLTHADAALLEKATGAVEALGPLERCSDLTILRAVIQPPDNPAIRKRVEKLHQRLAQIKALSDAGRLKEATPLAQPVLEEALTLGYPPITAEALLRRGVVSMGQPAQAEALLDQAIWNATAGGDYELFAEAAIQQIFVIGYLEGHPERAPPFLEMADATLHRLGGHPRLRAWLLNSQAAVLDMDGHYEQSITALQASLELKQKTLSPDDPDIANALGNIADPLARLGRFNEALEYNQRALDTFKKSGNDNSDVPMHLSSRGEYLNGLSRFVEAEPPARMALEIWERKLSPGDAFIAFPLAVIGRSYLGQGRPREAIAPLERAYRIRRNADPTPSRLGEVAFLLAQALWDGRGDRLRARALAVEAEQVYARTPEIAQREAVSLWLRQHKRASL
jgi:serine/threonine protein kinase